MSGAYIAEADIRAAILQALRGDAALMTAINGVYDGPPIRASVPYAVVSDVTGIDWGTKDAPGRELVLTLSLYDRAEDSGRMAQLMAAIHAAMTSLPRSVSGWDIGSIIPLRSRLIRGGSSGSSRSDSGPIGGPSVSSPIGGPWSWQSEWRLRVLKRQIG
jgi:Protein of unknown function (DUF3168)